MIRYTLKCDDGHEFESWFPSSTSYDTQRARGLVTCPTCNSAKVEKAVMAPSVARTDKGMPDREPVGAPASGPDAGAAAEAPSAEATPVAMMARPDSELRTLIRQLRDHIVANSRTMSVTASPILPAKCMTGRSSIVPSAARRRWKR